MRVLAFDTATDATSVALLDAEAGLELEERDDPPRGERGRHATRLMPLIAATLERAGGGWEAVDRIAVGIGPGTFTGLRIGVATARALGQGGGIPVSGISTLQSLARNACAAAGDEQLLSHTDTVLAVLDARRGEVFAAAWRLASSGEGGRTVLAERVLEPRALAPSALGALLPGLGRRTLALGPGAIESRSQLTDSGAALPVEHSALHRVTSLNHCRLVAGPGGAADEVRPDYLRLPDAELARLRRAGSSNPRAFSAEHRK